MISSLGIHVIHDEFTFTLRESTDLRESIWLGTTKIDLRENLSYFGNFLLNRTSEKCHTQQLQTHHALRSSQPLQSCPRSLARPARLHKPPMQSLREVPPWHVWCAGPAWRNRYAPRLPHTFKLPRPRDFRRRHCWGQVRQARLLGGQRQGPRVYKQWRETSPTCRQKNQRRSHASGCPRRTR